MSQEHAEASSPKGVDGRVKALIERSRGRLEQDPHSGSSECHRRQLGIVERTEHFSGDLAARQHARAAPNLKKRVAQLGPPRRQVLDAHRVIGADVGSRADCRDAIGRGLSSHLDGIREIAGSIVDPGEQMAVEIDRASV